MSHREVLQSGTRLGDCEILSVLGEGGFGITYLAWDTDLKANVALKEYFPSEFAYRDDSTTSVVSRSLNADEDYEKGLEEFQREARMLARFKHDNIVRVRKFHRANNTAYMVMDYEQGTDLGSWLKELKRPPRQDELDFLVAGVLDALDLIHGNDMLHRDIAPDNIYIRSNASPVLLDFGAARQDYAARSHTLQAIVKPGYSPHEQFAFTPKSQGPWTDIYSLSATLYMAMTGLLPPEAPNRVIQDEYIPAAKAARGDYRPGFLKAIDHGLAVLPRDRPQSVEEWREELFSNAASTRPFAPEAETPGTKPEPKGDNGQAEKESASGNSHNKRDSKEVLAVLVIIGILLGIVLVGLLAGAN